MSKRTRRENIPRVHEEPFIVYAGRDLEQQKKDLWSGRIATLSKRSKPCTCSVGICSDWGTCGSKTEVLVCDCEECYHKLDVAL